MRFIAHMESRVQSPAPPKSDVGCLPVLLGLERWKWEDPEFQVRMPASGTWDLVSRFISHEEIKAIPIRKRNKWTQALRKQRRRKKKRNKETNLVKIACKIQMRSKLASLWGSYSSLTLPSALIWNVWRCWYMRPFIYWIISEALESNPSSLHMRSKCGGTHELHPSRTVSGVKRQRTGSARRLCG